MLPIIALITTNTECLNSNLNYNNKQWELKDTSVKVWGSSPTYNVYFNTVNDYNLLIDILQTNQQNDK